LAALFSSDFDEEPPEVPRLPVEDTELPDMARSRTGSPDGGGAVFVELRAEESTDKEESERDASLLYSRFIE
jgi:hypothetical protein